MLSSFLPTAKTSVLDLGMSPREDLPDANYIEKHYPYPKKLIAASAEDCRHLKEKYPYSKIVKVMANKKLQFKNKQFDIATSWATLEHVGDYRQQEFFLNELLRVSRHIYVTTPFRGCIYEPHTGVFLLHWLPLRQFRQVCRLLKKEFWSDIRNLNPLNPSDINQMRLRRKVYVTLYKTLGWLPSHMIISDVAV